MRSTAPGPTWRRSRRPRRDGPTEQPCGGRAPAGGGARLGREPAEAGATASPQTDQDHQIDKEKPTVRRLLMTMLCTLAVLLGALPPPTLAAPSPITSPTRVRGLSGEGAIPPPLAAPSAITP